MTMNRPSQRTLSLALVGLWVIAVSIEAFRFRKAWHIYRESNETLERLAQSTNTLANQTAEFERSIGQQSDEINFLQSLVNVLPQERSFIRTEAAMADEVESLRIKVGRRLHGDRHILVDTRANKLYVKKGLELLWSADCSVGRGGILTDKKTGRRWEFVTPRGQFEVREKIEKPVWTKPDWAFVETGEPIPPIGDPIRRAEGELGGYVLNLGDGYLIHGTKNEALLGRPVSHGCVRLGADDLRKVYEAIPRGTRVYIY